MTGRVEKLEYAYDEHSTEGKVCIQVLAHLRIQKFAPAVVDYDLPPLDINHSEEDMKQFGLWLGNNLKKLKGKEIDDLYTEYRLKNLNSPTHFLAEGGLIYQVTTDSPTKVKTSLNQFDRQQWHGKYIYKD